MRIKYDDRTQIKNFKREKLAWRKSCEAAGVDLSTWLRQLANDDASDRGFLTEDVS